MPFSLNASLTSSNLEERIIASIFYIFDLFYEVKIHVTVLLEKVRIT